MANQTLTPEVMDVLRASTITGNTLKLPQQLERKLYEAVNKALTFAGGKWNRSAQGHVFPSDPRPKLGLILESGVAVDEKKKFQAFYTPPDLADEIAALAHVQNQFVLEPSAGEGALADACMKWSARQVTCVDINPEAVQVLKAKKYPAMCGDFLTMAPRRDWSRVVMNPPFTRGADLKHIVHALKFLAPGGMLVSVMLGKPKPKLAETLDGYEWSVKPVEAGAFKESGTNVATAILIVRSK